MSSPSQKTNGLFIFRSNQPAVLCQTPAPRSATPRSSQRPHRSCRDRLSRSGPQVLGHDNADGFGWNQASPRFLGVFVVWFFFWVYGHMVKSRVFFVGWSFWILDLFLVFCFCMKQTKNVLPSSRNQNGLPLSRPKRSQESFCSGDVNLFHRGQKWFKSKNGGAFEYQQVPSHSPVSQQP